MKFGNQKFQQFEKIRNRLNDQSSYLQGYQPYEDNSHYLQGSYQQRLQSDPRMGGSKKFVSTLPLKKKQKFVASPSSSDGSHSSDSSGIQDWESIRFVKHQKPSKKPVSPSSNSESGSYDTYSDESDSQQDNRGQYLDSYDDEDYDDEEDDSEELLTSFGKVLKKSSNHHKNQ